MKYKTVFLFSLLCLMYNITLAQNKPYEGNERGRISGQVTDPSAKLPLFGVNIVVKGTTKGTASDRNGNYDLKLPAGKHLLEINYLGYPTMIEQITVEAGSSQTFNFSLVIPGSLPYSTEILDQLVADPKLVGKWHVVDFQATKAFEAELNTKYDDYLKKLRKAVKISRSKKIPRQAIKVFLQRNQDDQIDFYFHNSMNGDTKYGSFKYSTGGNGTCFEQFYKVLEIGKLDMKTLQLQCTLAYSPIAKTDIKLAQLADSFQDGVEYKIDGDKMTIVAESGRIELSRVE